MTSKSEGGLSDEAVGWLRRAAEQGYAPAQTNLGYWLCFSSGCKNPQEEGIVWLRKAAAQGAASAQKLLGGHYTYTFKNPKEGTAWYRKAAEQGHAGAQVELGWKLKEGQGISKNTKEAALWFLRAAKQGAALAQFETAKMYSDLGNYQEAASWFLKSARQDYDPAKIGIAQLYAEGKGVAMDWDAAAGWCLPWKGIPADGFYRIGFYYRTGMNGFPRNDKKAAAWLKRAEAMYLKAAEQGDGHAQYTLGNMYWHGEGVSRNCEDAFGWYRKAAEQGNADAQNRLRNLSNPKVLNELRILADACVDHIPSSLRVQTPQSALATPSGVSKEDIQAMIQAEAARSHAATSAVSKAEIQAMIQAASKEVARNTGPTAKVVSSDVDRPAYAMPENPNNFAVIVGVEKYASLPAAQFAERDAVSVRAHLAALGYPERNIYFLSGQSATRAKIAQSVNTWLPKRVGENSTVFFYYAGHGAPSPQTSQAYLVPVDGDAEDLDSTAYPIRLLYSKLGGLKARKVIVALDSCFSGTGGRSVLAHGTRPLVAKLDFGGVPGNVIALTASDKTQISGTIEEQGHGAFTYYLLKGLGGAAKTASGHVTVQSLYDYLTPKVQDAARRHNRDQTPQLMPAGGEKTGTRLR